MKERSLQSFCPYRHGGVPIAIEMKVETKEGEGSEFIFSCPLSESRINGIKRLHGLI
jgi:hypothetical protein